MNGGPGTVVLRGKRIESIHRDAVDVVSGKVVDLTGRTILPGLIDLHVHVRASAGPPAMAGGQDAARDHFKALLRSGVTTVLDLGTEQHVVFEYRRRIRSGDLLAPSLLAVGPGLTPTGGHPCYEGRPAFDLCAFVDDVTDARVVMDALTPQAPDAVKVVIESGSSTFPLPELGADALLAIRESADASGIPVFAHVSEASDVTKALDAGVRFFAHLPVRDRVDAALAARLVASDAVVIPTAAVVDARYRASLGALEEVVGEEAEGDISRDVLDAWRDPGMYESLAEPQAREEAQRRRQNVLENIRACRKAGVTLVAGTDAGNPATFHGLSLRRELALYIEAGLSPLEALRTATGESARVMGLGDRGRIDAGRRADLIVVRGDPTREISALGEIESVYLHGERFDPGELAVGGSLVMDRKAVRDLGDGQTCLGEDECGKGSICTSLAWCRRACGGDDCAAGEACFPMDRMSSGPYCDPGDGCDPIAQDCGNGVGCVWLGSGVTRCWYPGKGGEGEACSGWEMCAPGFQCDDAVNRCVRLCDPTGSPEVCDVGQTCLDRSSDAGRTVGECR
jgi:imidazolonepropionase-like amidohydrolase